MESLDLQPGAQYGVLHALTPIDWMLQNRLLWNPVFAILMTWLYNRTNGSILAPALFHSAMNTFGNTFSITPVGNVLFIGLAILAIVSDRMWEKLPADHPAVYRELAPEIAETQGAPAGKAAKAGAAHVVK